MNSSTWNVEEYAKLKGLDPKRLRDEWGLEDGEYRGREAVLIPWRNPDGSVFRYRIRLLKSDGSKDERWGEVGPGYEGPPPDKNGSMSNRYMPLYGIDLIDLKAENRIILVEGESDVQALREMGIAAVGVAGASCFTDAQAHSLQAHDLEIYVHDEQDGGAETFIKDVVKKLGRSVRIFSVRDADPDCKDPCDLLEQCGVEGAKRYLDNAMAQAGLYGEGEVFDLASYCRNAPEPPEPLIHGLARPGAKMLIQSEPKAGKTTLMIRMMLAFANGGEVFGLEFEKCAGIFVNTEQEDYELAATLSDIEAATGMELHEGDCTIYNVTGKGKTLDKLADEIIGIANATKEVRFICIDSIYKVFDGDENRAEDVTRFTKALDRIKHETNCLIVYVHHYSKGAMNYSNSLYRGSGSNAFSRDAHIVLDLAPVTVKPEHRKALANALECERMERYLEESGIEIDCSHESADEMRRALVERLGHGSDDANALITELNEIDEKARKATGWRVSTGPMRGFAPVDPFEVWFIYPLHIEDRWGILAKAKSAEQNEGTRIKTERERAKKNDLMDEAAQKCIEDGVEVTRRNMRERMGKLDGKEVTVDMLKGWTLEKAAWSHWVIGEGQTLVMRESPGCD